MQCKSGILPNLIGIIVNFMFLSSWVESFCVKFFQQLVWLKVTGKNVSKVP